MEKPLKLYKKENLVIPFYHFVYVGKYYKYLRVRSIKVQQSKNIDIYFAEEKNSDFFEGERFDSHFIRRTMEQLNSTVPDRLNKVIMVIIHQFSDSVRRDLDNGCYKPIIDAVKKTKIIEDDSHFHLSLMLFGKIGEHEEINVLLIPHLNIGDFHHIIKEFI